MASMTVTNTTATHKSGAKKRVAKKQKVVSNGKTYNMSKLAARRTLKVKQ